jgi:hypothetical protein
LVSRQVASSPAKRVSVVNNGIVSVSLEARSRRREETGKSTKKGGMRKQRREGKGWGKADNERHTYQQVPTAVLATLRRGRTEEDGPRVFTPHHLADTEHGENVP